MSMANEIKNISKNDDTNFFCQICKILYSLERR